MATPRNEDGDSGADGQRHAIKRHLGGGLALCVLSSRPSVFVILSVSEGPLVCLLHRRLVRAFSLWCGVHSGKSSTVLWRFKRAWGPSLCSG